MRFPRQTIALEDFGHFTVTPVERYWRKVCIAAEGCWFHAPTLLAMIKIFILFYYLFVGHVK
jgi:hypothetical protein